MALAVGPIPLARGRKYKGWETSMLYFSLTYHVNYLMKVTGTQCYPMYPKWISCSLPGKRSSLRLWKYVSPKKPLLEKAFPFHHCLVQWRRRNSPFRSFKHTGSVNGYKRQRNLGTTAVRHTKTSFLNQLHHAGPKLTFLDDHQVTVQAILKDSLATSDYNKANCLNKQFYNNFHHSYPHINCSSARLHKPLRLSHCVTLHWRWSFWTDTWALVREIYWTWWNLSQDAKPL